MLAKCVSFICSPWGVICISALLILLWDYLGCRWFRKIELLKADDGDWVIMDALETGTWKSWKQRDELAVSDGSDAVARMLSRVTVETVYEHTSWGYTTVVTIRPESGGYVSVLEVYILYRADFTLMKQALFPPPESGDSESLSPLPRVPEHAE